MNITILLAIACGLIFFTLLAIMVIAVAMTLKWSYVALKEERRKMKGEHKDAGSNVGRDI
jgi:predicted ABC-type exoprotein transport system permease subunit